MRKFCIACLAAVLCTVPVLSGAYADTITLTGKIIPAESIRIEAPVSGTVDTVNVEEGQKVKADETLYAMKTTKIYAETDGTVTGIFGRPGDDAETVSSKYGAVLYLEGNSWYTVSASTDSAYGTMTAKFVHTGENVWLVCRANVNRSGNGIITGINGTGYTVEVTEGNFMPGDSVDIYRDEEYSYDQKIGRGTVSRTAPTAVTAAGGIVRIAVEDSAIVKRGDLLLETLDGTFDGYVMSGTEIGAVQDGIVGSISVQAGEAVQKGNAAAVIYPLNRMRVEASIPEDYCNKIHEGDAVMIELATDASRCYAGKVVLISSIATESDEEVTFRIVAEFEPDEAVRFGMTALVTAGEDPEPEEKKASDEQKVSEEPTEKSEESKGTGKSGRPEGRTGATDRSLPQRNEEGEQSEMPEQDSWAEPASEALDESGEAKGE